MADPEVMRHAIELLNRGRAHKRAGDFEGALPLYEQALEEVRRTIGERGIAFASSLSNLGLLLVEMGRYDRAEPLLRRAFDVIDQAADSGPADRSVVINNLAGLYQQMGQDSKAEPLFAEALALRQATGGEETPAFAQVLNNLALSMANLGRYEEAEPLAVRAVDLRRRTLPQTHPDIAQSLNNLGLLYEQTGRYAEADAQYREGIAIAESSLGAAHPLVARLLGNLASLQQHMGRFAEAEELFTRSVDAATRSLGVHLTTATLLGNLGMLYHDAGHFADAKQMFEAEAEMSEALRDVDSQRFAGALNHLGLVSLRMQEYDEATALLTDALNVCASSPSISAPLRATIINNMALVHLETGRFAEAEALLREAAEIRLAALGDRHPDYELCVYNLAQTLVPLARIDEALELFGTAATIDDQLISQVFGISADSERLLLLGMLQQRLYAYLSLVLGYRADDAAAVRAAFDFVLRRKGVGTEAAAAQRTTILARKYPDLDDEVTRLSALAAEITRAMMTGPGPEGTVLHTRRLADLTRRQTRLEADLTARISELRMDAVLRVADHAAVAAALPRDAVLVEFVRVLTIDFKAVPARGEQRWGPARYLAFVLHGNLPDEVRLVDVGDGEEIDRCITSAREAIFDPTAGSGVSIQTELRRVLFDPLIPALAGRRRVIVAPDGEVTTWPFEVLQGDDGRPLIEEYTFSYLSVARDILRFDAPSPGVLRAPLIVADPDYDLGSEDSQSARGGPTSAEGRSRQVDRSGIQFAALPATRVEGERIAALLGTSAVLGSAAREGLVKRHRAPLVLHVATHGFFLETDEASSIEEHETLDAGAASVRDLTRLENPLLRSGLALAGANTWLKGGQLPEDAEDGLLTAADVSSLDLQGTEIVVLSACQTGLGQIHTGEGVFGLRRAFVLAGARTLVMSLWEIPDEETAQLMQGFYQRVLAGLPRALALREAQLELRATRSEPFYWGAFICQGDPGPLRT